MRWITGCTWQHPLEVMEIWSLSSSDEDFIFILFFLLNCFLMPDSSTHIYNEIKAYSPYLLLPTPLHIPHHVSLLTSCLFFLFSRVLFLILQMCMSLCWYMHLRASVHRQQGNQIPLNLELQVALSHLTWVLRAELRSSTWAASAPNHWDISL